MSSESNQTPLPDRRTGHIGDGEKIAVGVVAMERSKEETLTGGGVIRLPYLKPGCKQHHSSYDIHNGNRFKQLDD